MTVTTPVKQAFTIYVENPLEQPIDKRSTVSNYKYKFDTHKYHGTFKVCIKNLVPN